MKKELLEALEEHFRVSEEYAELEAWTEGGYNVILVVEEWTEEEVIKAIEGFDPCHEIELWWHDDSFRANYDESMAGAQADMEKWKNDALKSIRRSLRCVKMQSASMYMTVRVDISFPETMTEDEAIEAAIENFDYDFRLKDSYEIDVDGMEICGINE